MDLPPERSNEPEWLQIQRRLRKEERSWNYGAWAATLLLPMPYAVLQAGLNANYGALAGVALVMSLAALIASSQSTKGTFLRGLAIWSAPLHGLATAVLLAAAAQ